jgi:hypothetical protein
MQIFNLCFSMTYLDVKSPNMRVWAFLWIIHVPRLIIEQCSTSLCSHNEQSNISHHSKLHVKLVQIDCVF